MIFNYALSHYSIEEVSFDETTYENLKSLLKSVDNENIILIVDAGGKIISRLKNSIKEFIKLKNTDYLFNLLEKIQDKRKFYRHNHVYEEDKVEEFIESIYKSGIILDAVITDQEEQNRFKKSIPLNEFSEEHEIDKERIKIHEKGINLIKLNQNELNAHYQRVVWDTSDFVYIDYNLGKFGLSTEEIRNISCKFEADKDEKKWRIGNKDFKKDYNDQTEKWWHGFNALKIAIEDISKEISKDERINIKIFTPQPFPIYNNITDVSKKIRLLEDNKKLLECLNHVIFNKLKTKNLDYELYYFDPLEKGKSELGKGPHNRYLFSASSKSIDVGMGLDIFSSRNKQIQQGRWNFSGDKVDLIEEIMAKNPRKIVDFTNIIDELNKSLKDT